MRYVRLYHACRRAEAEGWSPDRDKRDRDAYLRTRYISVTRIFGDAGSYVARGAASTIL